LDIYDAVRNAAQRAETLGHTRYKHSSILISAKGKVIAVGRNHFKGEMIAADDGRPIHKTVHSEIHALWQVNVRRLSGATIVNYACRNDTVVARPCDTCWRILKKLGLKKVIYSIHGPLAGPHKWKEEVF